MTTRRRIHFDVSGSTGWKDALVVVCLAIVLGAFVAQISTGPERQHAHTPVASAAVVTATVVQPVEPDLTHPEGVSPPTGPESTNGDRGGMG
jgi:hypothetical protein